MSVIALWITGLPGSGKSTIADAVKELQPDFTVLRMDELRKIITPEPTYSDSEREIVYRCLIYIAKKITEMKHNVIIDATGNKKKWREAARELIPGYAEIYLKCSIEECMNRERQRQKAHGAPKDIYDKGQVGWPVPGVNAPYEEPTNPEVLIDTSRNSINETVRLICDFLKQRYQLKDR
jgi:adenylylsulfate kinase